MTDVWLRSGEHENIADLLIGRTVTKVGDDRLVLDDGRELHLIGNEGGCSCGAGDYALTQLRDCPNVITRVEFIDAPDDDDSCEGGHYEIFVYSASGLLELAKFEGSDGNGYYGTGYTIRVTPAAG